jgi:hypothetical protein
LFFLFYYLMVYEDPIAFAYFNKASLIFLPQYKARIMHSSDKGGSC